VTEQVDSFFPLIVWLKLACLFSVIWYRLLGIEGGVQMASPSDLTHGSD
jgi:hypothetical protein